MTLEAGAPAYHVTLPEFEGPLDLLLHLCKTHELDIVNIPIAFVTEKYLGYLEMMESMSVDVAADYLVMAATLAYLKSRELVPAPEPLEAQPEEGELELDPREELIRRLLEYQKYKDAAEKLGARPIEGRTIFGRGAPVDVGDSAERAFADHSVWKLIEAFGKILEKSGGKAGVHNVLVDRVSIGDTMNTLLDRLETGGGSFRFDSCFNLSLPEAELRHQVVVTLLAMLELARLKVVRVLQSDTEETLFITKVTGASMEDARRAAAAQAAQAEQMEEAEQTGEAEQAGEAEQVEVAQQADEGEQVEVAQAAGEGEQAAEDRQTEGLEADASAEPDPAADAADQPMRTPEKIDEEA